MDICTQLSLSNAHCRLSEHSKVLYYYIIDIRRCAMNGKHIDNFDDMCMHQSDICTNLKQRHVVYTLNAIAAAYLISTSCQHDIMGWVCKAPGSESAAPLYLIGWERGKGEWESPVGLHPGYCLTFPENWSHFPFLCSVIPGMGCAGGLACVHVPYITCHTMPKAPKKALG